MDKKGFTYGFVGYIPNETFTKNYPGYRVGRVEVYPNEATNAYDKDEIPFGYLSEGSPDFENWLWTVDTEEPLKDKLDVQDLYKRQTGIQLTLLEK